MCARRFSAHVAPGPRGRGVIAVPFDPDQAWGAKAEHPVGGTIDGKQVRGTVAPGGGGWAFTVTPMWMRDAGVTAGTEARDHGVPWTPMIFFCLNGGGSHAIRRSCSALRAGQIGGGARRPAALIADARS